jgi:hypothetical protein
VVLSGKPGKANVARFFGSGAGLPAVTPQTPYCGHRFLLSTFCFLPSGVAREQAIYSTVTNVIARLTVVAGQKADEEA